MNWKSNIGQFYSRSDEGVFLGYSDRSKAYRVFNKGTLVVEESVHVKFLEQKLHHGDHTTITSESNQPPIVPIEPETEKKETYSLDDEKKDKKDDTTGQLTIPHPWRLTKDPLTQACLTLKFL